MIIGVGVDLVHIETIDRLIKDTDGAFVVRTFTENEIAEVAKAPDITQYYAGRYAVKEAAFKAIAPRIGRDPFDFRTIETLRKADGSPSIKIHRGLRMILDKVGINALAASISHDGDYAIAFVIAE
jgi:holo-[acyl-carrier protein] synthase